MSGGHSAQCRGQQTETGRDTRPSPAWPAGGCSLAAGASTQTAATGGSGGRLETRARPGHGPARPESEIQQPSHCWCHQEAALRPQCVSHRSTPFSENDIHLMFCRMCPLSLSVSPPASAAGVPPPPPGRGQSLCSLLSPVPTRHIIPDRSLSQETHSVICTLPNGNATHAFSL